MLEEWIRKGKEEGQNLKLKGNSKVRYLLVIIICLGLLAIIWPSAKTKPDTPATPNNIKQVQKSTIQNSMATDLEEILSQIDGAGSVDVSLTLSSDGVKTYASNVRDERRDIQENDNKGTKKTTSEKNITRDLAVSSGNPLLVEEKKPEILGVLVVADGAKSPVIRERLTNATSTLLNIAPHKINVMPRKGDL
ncbi:MAG TPA: hypothetical protein VFC73_09540 [Syntrophomonadaceae bacterium]|nr:hypothetical protein [Syntrophomonadaceae bacterium]